MVVYLTLLVLIDRLLYNQLMRIHILEFARITAYGRTKPRVVYYVSLLGQTMSWFNPTINLGRLREVNHDCVVDALFWQKLTDFGVNM